MKTETLKTAPPSAPVDLREERIRALEKCSGGVREIAQNHFERENSTTMARMASFSPEVLKKVQAKFCESERLAREAYEDLAGWRESIGDFESELHSLASARAELATAEQSLSAASALLGSPDSLDEPAESLVLAQQRVRFLPDQIAKRKKQAQELTARVKTISTETGIDATKLVAEMFAASASEVRRWHNAGFFKL